MHGAVAVSSRVPAGGEGTISIVFAWHFPDRDYSGEIVGNRYAELWKDAAAVAATLDDEAALARVVRDINAHHAAIAHADNPTPVWLKDMLLNQWSHMHMLLWLRDGRMREFEAWSCDDVDSVHNDYQRHLLYLWGVPRFIEQKLDAWSSWAQASDGHVIESLAQGFSAGQHPLDKPVGRVMADTTSILVIEAYEAWRHTANTTHLHDLWPSVVRAIRWCIRNANGTDGYGLPQYLTNTYDHFQFERRRAVAYNAHIYLAALQAAKRLAAATGDAALAKEVSAALSLSRKAVVDPARLWNSTGRFFRAKTPASHGEAPAVDGSDESEAHTDDEATDDTNQIFTDTLYGQMLHHHHFDGTFAIDPSYLEGHLAAEWAHNHDTYGMRVISNPVQEDSIWLNGPPTWAYLQLSLGNLAFDDALEPLRRLSENVRVRLADMWNLRALLHSDGSHKPAETNRSHELGGPREQGHYGFMLTDLYLLPLLSGQTVDLPNGRLELKPRFAPPYVLPVMLAGAEASLEARPAGGRGTNYTLAVAFGTLRLPSGGLVVNGRAVDQAVELAGGQAMSWVWA